MFFIFNIRCVCAAVVSPLSHLQNIRENYINTEYEYKIYTTQNTNNRKTMYNQAILACCIDVWYIMVYYGIYIRENYLNTKQKNRINLDKDSEDDPVCFFGQSNNFFLIDFDVFRINLMFVCYAMQFFFPQGKNCHKTVKLIKNHQN